MTPVGIGQTLGGRDRIAPALRGVTQLPLSHPNGPNLEQLAALNPQLVFSSPTWRAATPACGGSASGRRERSPQRRRVARDDREHRPHRRLRRRRATARSMRAEGRIGDRSGASGAARRCCSCSASAARRTRSCENSWGGDIVAPRRRRLLTGGARGRAAASRGSPTRSSSPQPRHHHRRARTPTPSDIPALARLPARRTRRGVSTTAARSKPRLRLARQLAAAGRHRRRPHDPQRAARTTSRTDDAGAARRTLVCAVAASLALAVARGRLAGAGRGQGPGRRVIDVLLGNGRRRARCSRSSMQLRLPRTVEAIVVGAALGVAGALLQGALANPLASPDVIGVTGGAGFGAMLILLALPRLDRAAAGRRAGLRPAGRRRWSSPSPGRGATAAAIGRLILAGIAISAAVHRRRRPRLLAAYPDRVPSAIFFLAGGLTSNGWTRARGGLALLRRRLRCSRSC